MFMNSRNRDISSPKPPKSKSKRIRNPPKQNLFTTGQKKRPIQSGRNDYWRFEPTYRLRDNAYENYNPGKNMQNPRQPMQVTNISRGALNYVASKRIKQLAEPRRPYYSYPWSTY